MCLSIVFQASREHIELEDMYEFDDDEPEMWYLNTGDTYSETIIATSNRRQQLYASVSYSRCHCKVVAFKLQ